MIDKKLEELQNKLQQYIELKISYHNDVCSIENENGYYCSCCFDYADKLVHLHRVYDYDGNIDDKFLICPKCKTKVLNPENK